MHPHALADVTSQGKWSWHTPTRTWVEPVRASFTLCSKRTRASWRPNAFSPVGAASRARHELRVLFG